jgi:hypothetical protein
MMPGTFHDLIGDAKAIFDDRLLQLLLLGSVLAAFVAFFVFDEPGLAIGVLAVGGSTAIIESHAFRVRRQQELKQVQRHKKH